MGTLKEAGALKIGDTFAFAPTGYNPENPEAAPLARLVCTGLIPISGQQLKRRARGMGDQYSVYYHAEGTTDSPTAKRVLWNQRIVVYAPANTQ